MFHFSHRVGVITCFIGVVLHPLKVISCIFVGYEWSFIPTRTVSLPLYIFFFFLLITKLISLVSKRWIHGYRGKTNAEFHNEIQEALNKYAAQLTLIRSMQLCTLLLLSYRLCISYTHNPLWRETSTLSLKETLRTTDLPCWPEVHRPLICKMVTNLNSNSTFQNSMVKTQTVRFTSVNDTSSSRK